ncbi:Uncharacterized protein conserved in bacteria (DUF2313) [Klebsiella pneumoniae]|uniref:Uncharacterized protein conserved in bacteria (DUF2313) n=1 Tax=Klebsiella pneumoniae TaxID=573 RepID=A0A378C9X0_KLEPN|nr:Uncharacterized protein conserved in bacteria (DUF2313) [Klebsiella pneumoniae]
MAHSVEDWQDVLQQLMPRGKAWPRDQTAALTSLLRGFSSACQLAEANADLLVTEMRPETTDLLLADWEDYLGLPDCNAIPDGFDRRRDAVVEKYHRKGGLATWQIEQAVKDALGFTIQVTENPAASRHARHHVSDLFPQIPLPATGDGHGYADDPLSQYQQRPDAVNQPAGADTGMFLRRYRLAGHDYDFLYEV